MHGTSPVAAILLLMLSSVALPQTSATLQTFDSPEGRFSILMPSKPKVEVQETDSALGKLTVYSYKSENDLGIFVVSFCDYPKEPTDAAQTQRVLEGVRDGVLKGSQTEMISDVSAPIEGYPGRFFKTKNVISGTEVIYNWKIALVGRRLYQMAVATTAANSQSPDIGKYFASFRLKK